MEIDFNKSNGLVPAIIQDHHTGQVLMLGYMDREALDRTIAENRVTFFSRSRNRLWTKGESSGNFLRVVSITPDCDRDTLLIRVEPEGPVCHTGSVSCFGDARHEGFLHQLEKIIHERKNTPDGSSYTSTLLGYGIDRVAQKVGEEAVEVVIASKNEEPVKLREETADLLYHLLVLLAHRETSLREVEEVLLMRHKKRS